MSKICKFFVQGRDKCRDGVNCRFNHVPNVCRFYFLDGDCKKGSECKFRHISNTNNRTNPNNNGINKRNQGQGQGHHHRNRVRNTESFEPRHDPDDIRVLVGDGRLMKYGEDITSRDIIVIPNLFCDKDDLTIYNNILDEIKRDDVWKLWHGDSHLIADDKTDWKDSCPTFKMVLNRIAEYFDMDIKATRLNWYRDSAEWKPYHHDAAAIKEDKARTQNFTVGVSFGLRRDASFEHAKNRTRMTVPLPNGSTYTFSDIVNVEWRHGILQYPPDKYVEEGRISIIAWGKVKMV